MRVDEMAAAASATSAMPVTTKPAASPMRRRTSRFPPRSRPKVKCSPDVDLAHGEALHEKVPDEILRRREREVPRERHEDERVDPAGLDRLLLLAEGLDHLRGARSGWRTLSGCGSNVTTTAGAPSSPARLATSRSIAWCPRCTPSKFPTVTTPPRGRSTGRKGSLMTCKRRV